MVELFRETLRPARRRVFARAAAAVVLLLAASVAPSCFKKSKPPPAVTRRVRRRTARRPRRGKKPSPAAQAPEWVKRGGEYLADADYQAARAAFAEACRLDPKSRPALEGLLRSGRMTTEWSVKLGEHGASAQIEALRPAPAGDIVLAAGDGAWYELDAFTGEILRTVNSPEKLLAIQRYPSL